MKFILRAIIFILIFCSFTYGQNLEIREGTKLIYSVNTQDENYEFIVQILQMEPDRIFAYSMTNSTQTTGKVSIKKKAIESANKQINYFNGGNLVLDDASTIWLSKQNFHDLLTFGSTELVYDDGYKSILSSSGESIFSVKIGESIYDIPVFIAGERVTNADNLPFKKSYLLLNDRSNPLIISMDLGWKVKLKEIIQPYEY
jgi:hypothetical protein